MRILIKYPTRSRPQKAIETLKKYIDYAKDLSKIQFLVSLDYDDTTANPDSFTQLHPNINVVVGQSSGKIGAVNRDMPDPSTFDILLLASDDMIPDVPYYDDIIRDRMEQYYPDTDGVLFFNDGYQGYRLNTLVICGSKYYQRFGYIYYPGYKSLFCDNEFMDTANILGKQTYFNNIIIRHQHFTNIQEKPDNLYKLNDTYWGPDQELYMSRQQYMYDVSILICTIPSRQPFFATLMEEIDKFKKLVDIKVEVVFDMQTDISIGQKRNNLLGRAKGKYSCFVDDDDKITAEYLKVIEDAINIGVDYDCIALNGRYYGQGYFRKAFYHSMKYTEWSEDEDGYYRNPNHLNPMKTSIMRSLMFKSLSHGEDTDFSLRLVSSGLIKTEYTHNVLQYHYYSQTNFDTTFLQNPDGTWYEIEIKYLKIPVNVPQKAGFKLKNGRLTFR
jgi:hypothetical protein